MTQEMTEMTSFRTSAELIERLDAKVQLVRLMRCSTPETINQNIHVHDKIIDAIAANDSAGAELIMREHIHPKGAV